MMFILILLHAVDLSPGVIHTGHAIEIARREPIGILKQPAVEESGHVTSSSSLFARRSTGLEDLTRFGYRDPYYAGDENAGRNPSQFAQWAG